MPSGLCKHGGVTTTSRMKLPAATPEILCAKDIIPLICGGDGAKEVQTRKDHHSPASDCEPRDVASITIDYIEYTVATIGCSRVGLVGRIALSARSRSFAKRLGMKAASTGYEKR